MPLRPAHARLAALALCAFGPLGGEARAAEPGPPADASAPASAITPPERLRSVDAVYPAGAEVDHEVLVELDVTVGVDGRVAAVAVHRSGGPAFDAAAIAAVAAWAFAPARRGDEVIAAKIRVPFTFPARAPGSTPGPVPEGSPDQPVPGDSSDKPAPKASSDAARSELPTPPRGAGGPEELVLEVEVRGQKQLPQRAASDLQIDDQLLRAAPKPSAGDLLSTAPGVYVARPEGEAVAHEIILRGFDAAHGQDIELTLGGALPLNQISHIHGQGYADLGIVIPEVVRSLRVREGVYDPRQGDFAVAGSIDFDLGVRRRGTTLQSRGGSFGTFRQLVLFAPKGQAEETFAAATVQRTSGFGVSRGGLSGAAIGQFVLRAGDHVRVTLHAAAQGARAGMAGVLRQDDVERGVVGFYDAYPDPSARSQSASSGRGQVMIDVQRRGDAGERTRLAIWSAYSDLRVRQNFTGYLQRSMVMPEWVGRGDLIEQHNADVGGGFLASHRTRTLRPNRWFSAALELGTSARLHRVDQAQNLLQAPGNETWDHQVDARLRAGDIGVYGDLELGLGRIVTVRGGARADVLHYDIDDRLGNFIAPYQVASHLVGYRRTALGVAAGPRVSVEVRPARWITTFLSYGQGYRSPQARLLSEGENAPFAKVHSAEGGLRLLLRDITVSAAGFTTFLSSDLAFDPGEGRLEKIGPTQRSGLTVHAIARAEWLVIAASVTYVRAVLQAPPPATAENPAPAFEKGQLLPYVPPVVVRADVGYDDAIARIRGRELGLRVGAGYGFLSPRPLPYGEFAAPVHQLDATLGLRYAFVELGVDVQNLLNRRIAATEYNFVSSWGTTPQPSLLPARHFAAAPPLSAMGTLTLHF